LLLQPPAFSRNANGTWGGISAPGDFKQLLVAPASIRAVRIATLAVVTIMAMVRPQQRPAV
jgi:hypothetical protein